MPRFLASRLKNEGLATATEMLAAAAASISMRKAAINQTLTVGRLLSHRESSQLSPGCLGSLALLRHARDVLVRFKCLVMSTLFKGLRSGFVEDHLVADVVITLLI